MQVAAVQCVVWTLPFQHVVERMGDMLLPHLMGAYRLTVDNVETYLLVMMNIMWSNLTLHRKFDLKGSLINRAVKEKEKVRFTLISRGGEMVAELLDFFLSTACPLDFSFFCHQLLSDL